MSLSDVRDKFLTPSYSRRAIEIVRVVIGYALLIRGFWSWMLLKRVYGMGLCTVPNFDLLPVIPVSGIPLFGIVWCLAAFLFMLGVRVRVTGTILILQVAYYVAMDEQLYASHLYLMWLICLVVTLAYYFEDAFSGTDDPSSDPKQIAYWPLFLLKVQLSIVYFFAAITKLTPGFLGGDVIVGMLRLTGLFSFPKALLVPAVVDALVWGTIATELFLSFAFWWKATRRLACLIGLGFHLFILVWIAPRNFWELVVFALEMFAMYSVYFWKPKMTEEIENQ